MSREEATAIAAGQIAGIRDQRDAVCEEVALSTVDKQLFWRRQFPIPSGLKERRKP